MAISNMVLGNKSDNSYALHQPVLNLVETATRLDLTVQENIITRIIRGDDHAFETLVDDFKDMVYNVCLNFLGNRQEAEEVAQDVFLRVFQNSSSFRQDASLKRWIYRIAITTSLEALRTKKRKKRWSIFVSLNEKTEQDYDRIYFDHSGIENADKENADKLHQAIRQLSENQQTAFTMHHIEGLSYQEISEIMNNTISAVESLIFRAKRNLRKKLIQKT